jgi:methylenetetrahydrofolate reductase (NADPH)
LSSSATLKTKKHYTAYKVGLDLNIKRTAITNYTQLVRFSNMCGAKIPSWILKKLELYQDDLDSLSAFGLVLNA